MTQPEWLSHALRDLGTPEIAGDKDNPSILSYYREVGHPQIEHDEIAWCAAFAGACLERSGIPSTRSLLARSYLEWGNRLNEPRLGAITVLSRGSNPSAGHVGFYVGTSGSRIFLLGGNQGDAVSLAPFDSDRLLGWRWPVERPRASDASADDVFEIALAHVLRMEGGWTDDPYDPGGPTNKGITLATLAAHLGTKIESANRAELLSALRDISAETVSTIYARRYWAPSAAARLRVGLALMHFDASVNHGVSAGAVMLQQAVGADPDGEIGPLTLKAAFEADERAAISRYADLRRARYRRLHHFWRFGRGWLARVDKTLVEAIRLHADPPANISPSLEEIPSMPDNTNDMPTKWWGESLTIWGTLLTALTTVLPVIGTLLGLDLSREIVETLGAQLIQVVQAAGGLIGTLLAILGRARASSPLARRPFQLRM